MKFHRSNNLDKLCLQIENYDHSSLCKEIIKGLANLYSAQNYSPNKSELRRYIKIANSARKYQAYKDSLTFLEQLEVIMIHTHSTKKIHNLELTNKGAELNTLLFKSKNIPNYILYPRNRSITDWRIFTLFTLIYLLFTFIVGLLTSRTMLVFVRLLILHLIFLGVYFLLRFIFLKEMYLLKASKIWNFQLEHLSTNPYTTYIIPITLGAIVMLVRWPIPLIFIYNGTDYFWGIDPYTLTLSNFLYALILIIGNIYYFWAYTNNFMGIFCLIGILNEKNKIFSKDLEEIISSNTKKFNFENLLNRLDSMNVQFTIYFLTNLILTVLFGTGMLSFGIFVFYDYYSDFWSILITLVLFSISVSSILYFIILKYWIPNYNKLIKIATNADLELQSVINKFIFYPALWITSTIITILIIFFTIFLFLVVL